jgi:hypothetical protein
MNETWKTLSFVAVALLLTGAAIVSTRERTRTDVAFNDQGTPFFPNFKNPLECTDLEVVDFDPSTATATRFRVMFKDNQWVIPSHYNYPADAKDRLAKTAGAVTDLIKDTIRSDSLEDQEKLGVLDPLDTKSASLQGRGKRVTLRDKTEKVLADFIIGNEIKDHSGQRYIRVPDQKRIYGVVVKADLSTRFADWIETNLLKLEANKLVKVTFDNYKVNPDQAQPLQRGEILTIDRKNSTSPWTLPGLSAEQEVDPDKTRALSDALADLKIVGVRPKPAGLTRDLKKATPDSKGITLSNSTILSLQSKGFYMTRDGRLLSNQGDVLASTDEGIVYTIRFGEVVFGSGDELTAGTADDDAKTADAKDQDKDKSKSQKAEGTAENRYVMVTASFDPSLIPKPNTNEDEKAVKPGQIPDNVFAPTPEARKTAQEKAERDKADYEKKIADGKKRAQELTDRFANWYYVTTGDSFRAINLDRAELVRAKKPATPGGDANPFSGLGGSGGAFPHPNISPGSLPPAR